MQSESTTSPNGNHTIALLNTTENYDNLTEALENIANEVKTLQSITVDGITFTVEYFLRTNWKFLVLIVGIEAATAKYFCIWCNCAAEDRSTWSMEDTEKGTWTIEYKNFHKLKSRVLRNMAV